VEDFVLGRVEPRELRAGFRLKGLWHRFADVGYALTLQRPVLLRSHRGRGSVLARMLFAAFAGGL
jgi:hypothetical protein